MAADKVVWCGRCGKAGGTRAQPPQAMVRWKGGGGGGLRGENQKVSTGRVPGGGGVWWYPLRGSP